ncbi:unnamed protein product, partial [Ascophyllum nodosum]
MIPSSAGWCLLVQFGGYFIAFICPRGSSRLAWLLWLSMRMSTGLEVILRTKRRKVLNQRPKEETLKVVTVKKNSHPVVASVEVAEPFAIFFGPRTTNKLFLGVS